jgi:hypothetical protein
MAFLTGVHCSLIVAIINYVEKLKACKSLDRSALELLEAIERDRPGLEEAWERQISAAAGALSLASVERERAEYEASSTDVKRIHADVDEILQGLEFLESFSRQINAVAKQTRTKFKMSKEAVINEAKGHAVSNVLKTIGKMNPNSTSRMEKIREAEQARKQVKANDKARCSFLNTSIFA